MRSHCQASNDLIKSPEMAIVPWVIFMLQIIYIISGAWSLVLLARTGLILFDGFYLGLLQQSKSKADKRKSAVCRKSKTKPTFCRLEASQY